MSWKTAVRQLWPRIEKWIPSVPMSTGQRGRPCISDEAVFYRLVLFLRAGCSWEVFDLLLSTCGGTVSGRTVRRRLSTWRRLGVFESVCRELQQMLPRAGVGYLDATFVRSRGGGNEEVGLTRHGKGSKLQVICDEYSRPISFLLLSANPAECRSALELLRLSGLSLPLKVVADRAYDSDDLRDGASSFGTTLIVPHRRRRVRPARDQDLVAVFYRERWRVERFFGWLAAWRRVATRWERGLQNYGSFLCLALSLMYVQGGVCT